MKFEELIQLKRELVDSMHDESMMKRVLRSLSELSKGELCAFYTEEDDHYLSVMLENRELTTCLPEIREKLKTAYQMFTNSSSEPGVTHENVFYVTEKMNVAILMGNVRVESYFIVPVIDESMVCGVLFIGSPRKDAFNRNDIRQFRELAEEGSGARGIAQDLDGVSGYAGLLLEALPFGAAHVSLEGQVQQSNELFGSVLQTGRSQPETIYEISHFSPFDISGIWDEFKAGSRNLVERELIGSGAAERSIAVTFVRLAGLSDEYEVLLILRDTTSFHERERAKEEMLATVAHEIRTPMTALKNSLGIILDSTSRRATYCDQQKPGSSNAEKRFLEMALRTISRLEMLVDGLIDVSTVRKADRPLELDLVSAEQFLEEASLLFIEPMRKKGIQFSVAVEERAREIVFDSARMEQIIQNLLANAMKNVPSGGSISVSVAPLDSVIDDKLPLIPWKYLSPPQFIDLCVLDTGTGIPRKVIDDINPLPERRGAIKKPSRGLGLYIARKLMQQHGGVLVAERREDGGSAVHLYLPADQKTRMIIQTVYSMDQYIDRMIDKGLSPVLYTITKQGEETWMEALAGWETKPVLNPDRDEIAREGVFLWSLSNSFAMAITAEKRYMRDPSLLAGGAGDWRLPPAGLQSSKFRMGWAVGPMDGTSYSALIAVSLGRAVDETVTTT